MISSELSDAAPDFEAVYHVVVDAVDAFNEVWERECKTQQVGVYVYVLQVYICGGVCALCGCQSSEEICVLIYLCECICIWLLIVFM